MRVLHEIIMPTSDASITETSLPGLLAHVWGYSIQAIFTGVPVGTLRLQGSVDPVPDSIFSAANYAVVNWTDIANSSQAVTGAGTIAYDVVKSAYSWVRAIYTPTSGTGTVTVQFFTKGY